MVPELRSSQYAYHDRVISELEGASAWLDVGCGHQIFGDWMTAEEKQAVAMVRHVVGTDLDFEAMNVHGGISDKVMANLEALPFADGVFDLVTANMVVEHLLNPVAILKEIARVVRPHGVFVFHTPNLGSPIVRFASKISEAIKRRAVGALQGRKDADIFKTHYRFNTAGDIERIAEQSGFEIKVLERVSTSAMSVMLGPVAVYFELLYLRHQRRESEADKRTNLVGVLMRREA